ncbi:ParB/RepB/Spo0J family partition protein [Caballeronia sp. LP003]|uniref:ParB/RepB/Spo0J family partition protein n=1 Tax=Caballeronia sp. LP003 TaxID=3038551 RepID=UPI00285518DF|nr:ParB/RepB/Spo0J family partition protein [Caballeronia sp. LP003]MDR5791715.1 ParB/RepB/Spo0J family partition protein [Caballeronia sp. LP003]
MKKSMLDRMEAKIATLPAETTLASGGFQLIPLSKIRFNPNQPRKDFHALDGQVPAAAQEALKELAADIEANDLMHPITVKEVGDGEYEVVIGERRTRAFKLLKRESIPAKIRSDLEGVKLDLYQLAENIQRQDLNENDLAQFIHKIVQGGEVSKQNLGKMFNKPASWVTRYLSFADPIMQTKWVQPGYVDKAWILYALLQLPEELQNEALEICKARNSPLTSRELKGLEARAKRDKDDAAQEAAQRAANQESEQASAKGKGQKGGKSSTAAPAGEAPSPILSLLDDGAGGNTAAADEYRPDAKELAELRKSPNDSQAGFAPSGYANDDANRDLSGHEPIANMHRMNAAATATVTSRVSLDQLVAVQRAIAEKDVGAQMKGIAVEFRADESLLRAVLAALGEDVSSLPTAVLTLKLSEVAQGLIAEQ